MHKIIYKSNKEEKVIWCYEVAAAAAATDSPDSASSFLALFLSGAYPTLMPFFLLDWTYDL